MVNPVGGSNSYGRPPLEEYSSDLWITTSQSLFSGSNYHSFCHEASEMSGKAAVIFCLSPAMEIKMASYGRQTLAWERETPLPYIGSQN